MSKTGPSIDELAYQMFRDFSKFEFALKSSNYFQEVTNKVNPDWDRFISTYTSQFERVSDPVFLEACERIDKTPPKIEYIKEINGQKKLKFKDRIEINGNYFVRTFKYVRRARNNLFHGGKLNDNDIESGRNRQFILDCITILSFARNISTEVSKAFDDAVLHD